MIHSLQTRLLLLASLVIQLTQAQTASCNPLQTSDSCPGDAALADTISESFKTNSSYFTAYSHSERISYSDGGAQLTLAKRYDNPGLKSNFYIMFGRLEIQLKAAPGQGVVSSFYMQSDDLDEIDLEWIGSDTTEVQSNYFSKGNTTTYSRGKFHPVSTDPTANYHNYTIDWTQDALSFYVDGENVRTINSDDPEGYPQSPMYVVTGIWAGGDPDNAAGTIEWAGGEIDYSSAPYTMYVKNAIISDYSTGSEYVYSDQSGEWSSIEAVNGEVNGRYEEGVEQFSVLSLGGSPSSSYGGLSSSYSRHSAMISTSTVKSSSSSGLVTRSDKSAAQVATSNSATSKTASSSETVTSIVSDSTDKTTSSGNSTTSIDSGSLDNSSAATALREGVPFGFGSIGMNAIMVTISMSLVAVLVL